MKFATRVSANGNRITDLAAATQDNDAVRKEQLLDELEQLGFIRVVGAYAGSIEAKADGVAVGKWIEINATGEGERPGSIIKVQ